MRSVLLGGAWALALSACGFSASTGVIDGDSGIPDSVTIGFLSATSLEDERSGTIGVPVHLSAPSTVPVAVTYAFADGSATQPMDYAGTGGTLTFAPGETDQVIQVTIHDDGVDETANETFDIELSSPQAASLGTAKHTVTISANILPRVSFALGTSAKAENQQETFVATLDLASPVPVSVDYALAGSATNADYGLTAGTINFPVGTQSQSFTLDPVDDALDEDNETVRITLVSSVNAAIASSAATRVHTLEDNDPLPFVAFVGATRTVGEDVGTITLTVQLNTPSGRQVTVPFATQGGASATANDDFAYESTAALVFPAGTTSRTIDIAITDDAIDEDSESFVVALGTATNATVGAGLFNVTITDDDSPPSVRWNTAGRSASEGDRDTSYDYELVLSAPSSRTITVPVEIGGTAEAVDYMAPASVTFMPGQTSRNFRLTIVGDNDNNPEDANVETVIMTLTSTGLTNAVQGSPNQVTHTIEDDD